MITPEKSLLVLLQSEESQADPASIAALRTDLVQAANVLSFPVFRVHYGSDQAAHGTVGDRIPLELGIDHWAASKLGRAIAETERDQIVVAGAWLEEAVTFFALNAVAHGLDVYCPVDAIATLAPPREHVCYSRLAQAGVVQTTTLQVLREWAALAKNPATRQALLELARARAAPS